ncbi:protein kinase family protein [Nostoc sp. 106C]|uniref:serine/threonine protein kinase n=1 Tax=Nostoc sp. 106C TaxID=1932667 RepID=UPI000A36E93A|nr:protein kinase family protein [Nostoc sp. 106C]
MINSQNFQPPKFFILPQDGHSINHNGMKYVIGEMIGQGNFGKVYKCEDEWSNELVAKILIPRNQSYEEVQQKWLEEIDKLVYLRHPNITFVYDAFEYRNTFYLIIERCHCTLEDLLNLQNFQGDVWLPHIARDLLQGIHFMHNAGYVHKDIHHGNVFVSLMQDKMIPMKDPVLRFKIGDLGISILERDIDVFNTTLAAWMLPPEYLAPQKFGLIGRQVDIYHIGLLLLSLLLGKIPQFTYDEILAGKPRQIAESLSSRYSDVIARALRRHVAYRTQSALDFWREILEASKF